MSQASRGGSSTQPPSNSTSPPSSTSSSLRGYVSDDWNRGVRQEERSREYASDDPTSKPSVGIIGSRIGGADTPGKKPFLSRNRRWQRGNSLVQKNNAFGSNLANWGLPSFSSNKHSRSQVLSPPLARNTQYGSGYRKESRSKYYQQRHRADQTPNNSKPRRAVRKKRNSEPNAWRATLGLDGKSHPPTMTKYASPEILHPKTGKPVDPLKYKTALCSHFAKHGSCEFGSKCIFAHGHDELFQRQLEIKRIKAMEEEKEKLEREILVTESTLQKAQEPFLEMIQGVINDNESPSDKNSSQAMSQARSPGIRGLSSDIWSPPPPGFDPKVNPSSGTASAKQSLDRRPPLAPNLSPSMSPSVAANMYEIPPLISGSLGSDSLSSARDVIPDSEVSTQKFLLRKVKSAPKSSLSWPGPPKVASEDRIRDKNYNSQDKINMQQTPQSDTSSDGTALSAKTSPPGSEERVIVLENEVKQLRKALFLQQKQREAESRKKAEWERDKRAYTKKQPEFLKRKANSVLKKKVSDPTLAKAKSDGYKLVGVQWWKFLLGFIAILVFLNLAYFFMQSQSQKPGEGSPDQERDGLATVTHRKNDIVWVLTNDRGWRLAKVSKSVSDDREYRSARKHQRKDSVLMVHLLSRDHGIAKSSSYHDDYQVENGENVDSKAPSALAFRVEDQIKRVHPALLADRSSFKSFQQIIPILAKHNFPKLDVSLAEEVCLSLGDLARSPLHRAAIHGTAGVLSAVVGVLNSFSEIQSLQEACILALGNLAQAESATIKGLKESGELPERFLICEIMRSLFAFASIYPIFYFKT